MSFFLTEDQEGKLNEFLEKENRKVCQEQLNSSDVPDEFKPLIEKTLESDSPLPFFDPAHGYYSVSFTPCDQGNRIYVHHHISNVSEAIYDPSKLNVNLVDGEEILNSEIEEKVLDTTIMPSQEELITESTSNYNDQKIGIGTVTEDGIAFPS